VGALIDGRWHGAEDDFPRAEDGRFVRRDSAFRDWVTPDGAPGPTGGGGFAAEAGRYHLTVSLACPWASRTLIARKLKRLEGAVSLSIVDPLMGANGWVFSQGPGCIPDTVNGFRYLHEAYSAARPGYTGRVTVPVLWDTRRGTIVNNESAEILRMFDAAFARAGAGGPTLYPAPLRDEIDAVNARVYTQVNNGVYRAGFATSQAAYEEAASTLFTALDWLEDRLGRQPYLVGNTATEADWRLFTTLVRFDAVYVGHFKCNRHRLADYPHLWAYTRALYQVPGIAETVDLGHIKRHYYMSHAGINPTRIVPKGPEIDFLEPHGRDG